MEEEVVIRNSGANSMTSAMVGRAMNSLLSSRPKKLEDAIVRLGDAPISTSLVSLEDSLWFLSKYVRDAAERGEALDEVLVPMIENSLRCKVSKNVSQAIVLLNWLFQDEVLFHAFAKDIVTVIQRKEDHYIALGWCNLTRGLIEYESTLKRHLKNGLRERHHAFLKILCPSISYLSLILCKGSVEQDGFELPTRLAMAAADCILVLTEGLTKKPSASSVPIEGNEACRANESQKRICVLEGMHVQKKDKSLDISNSIELGLLLWENLDKLITLVEKLHCWFRKSRPLHAEGSKGVLKWLKAIKSHHGFYQDEAGSMPVKAGVLLLSSCWKHYSMLLRLEDHQFSQHFKELMDQYLSGIEFYSEDGDQGNVDSIRETRKFFVNCLALLLGRLDCKRLASIVPDYGIRVSNVLLAQLHCADEDLINGVICIFKLAIFKTDTYLDYTGEMEEILPSLLNLLDKRDSAARAAVVVLAHYCSISANKQCYQEVLKHSVSGNVLQRRNAIEFISELIHISTSSGHVAADATMKDLANHLLDFLGDDDSVIRNQTIKMLPLIDPPLVLPAVIRLIYSSNDTISSAASNVFVAVLRHHDQSFEVISLLLDSLSKLHQGHDHCKASEEKVKDVSAMDVDRVFRLIPEWSETVHNWNSLIEPLLGKMFSDPSNATIVRFLSCISNHLADAADVVLGHLLLQAKGQEIDESIFASGDSKIHKEDDKTNLQYTLFSRLCPLLIIKLLPLKIFDDITSNIMYGQILHQVSGSIDFNICDYQCVAAYMYNRAFSRFEFEDVRKLSAELCGRIHPQVLYAVVFSQLEGAAELKDTLRIKACLFTICTSLVVRGKDAVSYPTLMKIRQMLQIILLWPSVDGDEVAKAQHGCIDCLALMICAELQDSKTSLGPALDTSLIGGDTSSPGSCLAFVINCLTDEKLGNCISSDGNESCPSSTTLFPLSYRLCMANVLISACQKIPDSCKKALAQKTLPHLFQSVKKITNAEIRAGCTQVLFSAVYHLKLAVLPYTSHLLNISLVSLKEGSERERTAGAKLLASLLGSEEPIVESISGRMIEVRSVLFSVSESDAEADLRQICQKMLACLTC